MYRKLHTVTHTFRLLPGDEQVAVFVKSCRVARYAYNWALERWSNTQGSKPDWTALRKQFNAAKAQICPQALEVCYQAAGQAFKEFGADANLYRRRRGPIPQQRVREAHERYRADNEMPGGCSGSVIEAGQIGLSRVGSVTVLDAPAELYGIHMVFVHRKEGHWYVDVVTRHDGEPPTGPCSLDDYDPPAAADLI